MEKFFATYTKQSSHPYLYFINKEHGYEIGIDTTWKSDYHCESTPVKTAIIWDDNGNQVKIPFEDGVQLLKDNFECFNHSTNKPARSTAYSIRALE